MVPSFSVCCVVVMLCDSTVGTLYVCVCVFVCVCVCVVCVVNVCVCSEYLCV